MAKKQWARVIKNVKIPVWLSASVLLCFYAVCCICGVMAKYNGKHNGQPAADA